MHETAQFGGEPAQPKRRRVLAVDDEPETLLLIERVLSGLGLEVETLRSGRDAVQTLNQDASAYASVLFDLHMPDVGGLEVLERAKRAAWDVPIVVVAGQATVGTAVEAMRLGAFDLLTKPFHSLDTLVETTFRAMDRAAAIRRERPAIDRYSDTTYTGLVGTSPPMRELFALIEAVAPTDATVLLQGETGTGKELVARSIHARSSYSSGVFLGVSCGDIEASATAVRDLLSRASGGTLFLDELAELRLHAQAKLLFALESRDRPRGASTPGARIVATTGHDLTKAIRAGTFRGDLYYRLRVVPVVLPPLRKRAEDIPLLLEHLARKHASRLNRPAPEIHPSAVERAASASWPGNVRELENAIERAVILGGPLTGDAIIQEPSAAPAAPRFQEDGGEVQSLTSAKRAFEREYLTTLLSRSKGNRAVASRLAGLDPSNLRRLLRRHGLS